MSGKHIYLQHIEEHPQPGPYSDAIAAAEARGTEYWGIWNILAYDPVASYHLCELSHQLMHRDAPISAALRELIAAYTSALNDCDFCRNAHAAVAAQIFADADLVAGVLNDPETSRLSPKEKTLLRFVKKLTLKPGLIQVEDVEALTSAGWNEPSIYYTITACSLFNYYNRFVLGNGVQLVSSEAFAKLGARMARDGYSRERPPQLIERTVTHA